MKPTTLETLIADQQFKINKSDENISDYLIDCGSPFNSPMALDKSIKVFNGAA